MRQILVTLFANTIAGLMWRNIEWNGKPAGAPSWGVVALFVLGSTALSTVLLYLWPSEL